MSSISLNNMPSKNAYPIKSGRVKSKRNKTKYCKTMGCMFFTKDTHCSGCKAGLPKKKAIFKKKLGCVVNIMTRRSAATVGDTVLDTLKNIRKSGKIIMFKAKDVLHLFGNDYELSSMSYDQALLSPRDKILLRVVDYWNLHKMNGFHTAIQCYWNTHHFDNPLEWANNLYYKRATLFDKRSLRTVLGEHHKKFDLIWKMLLSSEDPVPNPSTVVQECIVNFGK